MHKLVWRPEAEADLEAIIDYISDRNAAAALNLRVVIGACAERLSEHPYLHRRGRIPGTREAVVHPNYILIYAVNADSVEIMGIIHSRRKYPPAVEDQPS
jgi:addiction module RelE/StbE family toxin